MLLELDIVKKHLNLESAFTEDDEYILSLMSAAEKAVEVHCNKTFEEYAAEGGSVPAPLMQAALLMIGNLYQNREIVGAKTLSLPFNYQYLIDLFKNYN